MSAQPLLAFGRTVIDNGSVPLRIHIATRADKVIVPLAQLLAAPAGDPLAAEVVGIPTRGMERWLAQELAQVLGARRGRRDGITANVEFRFPGWLVGQALAAPGTDPDRDPWRPEAAVWALLGIVDEIGDPTPLGPLAEHIGLGGGADSDDLRRNRRYRALRHVADLFDRYAMHRPQMVEAWAAGDLEDGDGGTLPREFAWQPRVWQLLRERIDRPSMPERLAVECDRIRRAPDSVDLPARLAIVGVSRMPATYLQVLEAVAASRRLDLFLLHPSPALWTAIQGAGHPGRGVRRSADPTAVLVRNPLLGSWGRDAREMQIAIGGVAEHIGDDVPGTPVPGLLGHLQADIRENRAPGASGRIDLDPDDTSIQIHSCHGRARQVEVLRDAILHLFRADPTLEPRDVLVLCPDIEAFAPLLEATLGTAGGRAGEEGEAGFPGAGLRVEIADRSLRATNPVVAVIARVMALADDRMTGTQLLELAALDPVRRRFAFGEDDLGRLEQLVADAGIRWGLDAADRARYSLADVSANTWRSGLDRMMLGIAVGDVDDHAICGVTPLAGLDAGAIDLVGRLAEFVDRVETVTGCLRQPQPVSEWIDAITDAADLLTDVELDDAWQRFQLTDLLGDLEIDAGDLAVDLTLREIRGIIESGLESRGGTARYRSGRITASSLVPMRGVPHRVICLLGLDDGVFPRAPGRDGDDITLRDPVVGDRDPRGDDLQQPCSTR